jgi:hypothetical protein
MAAKRSKTFQPEAPNAWEDAYKARFIGSSFGNDAILIRKKAGVSLPNATSHKNQKHQRLQIRLPILRCLSTKDRNSL